MPSSVLVGLAVSSHVTGVNCTATFDSVTVELSQSQQPTLPPGWSDQDIGAVTAPGGATFGNNVFSVSARGADIWGSADAFHYAYRTLNGDGTVIARVASVTPANAWSKGGLMIRESVAAGARHAFILVSSSKGVAFQRRATTNGTTVSTSGSLAQSPRWVKLTRAGSTFSAYESSDGSTWTLVGTATITMNANVLVGLAVTSHTTTASTTVTFDNVIVP
jgi:hypothetical protein